MELLVFHNSLGIKQLTQSVAALSKAMSSLTNTVTTLSNDVRRLKVAHQTLTEYTTNNLKEIYTVL